MGILNAFFQVACESVALYWKHLMFRDTSRLPKEERPEAEAEAIVAGLILVVAVVFAMIAWFVAS